MQEDPAIKKAAPMTSGDTALTALRLSGEKVYKAARSCSRDRPGLVTPPYRRTRL